MTKQRRKSASQFRGLKGLLAAGSLAAALLGTHLLAANDQVDTGAALPSIAAVKMSVIPPPSLMRSAGQAGTGQISSQQFELAPIPTAAARNIRVVVRSRSSR